MKMFEYLNQTQVSDLMLLFCVADNLDKMLNEWVEHKNMTKTEAKYLRTSRTYMSKFMNELQARISNKEKDKLIKRYSNFHMQIMDKWLLDKFERKVVIDHHRKAPLSGGFTPLYHSRISKTRQKTSTGKAGGCKRYVLSARCECHRERSDSEDHPSRC